MTLDEQSDVKSDISHKQKRVLILIPARFNSSRFPGKPLAEVKNGQSMIEMVYQNCLEAFNQSNVQDGLDLIGEVAVVTDDDKIAQHLKDKQINFTRVDDDVVSGTERVALAYKRFFKPEKVWDLVLNVQGDEPLLSGLEVRELIKFHLYRPDFSLGTMVTERRDPEGFNDPNRVKAIWSPASSQCLYFSRASIPYDRDRRRDLSEDFHWYLHIGIYSFVPTALEKFVSLKVGELEEREKLEQLRALENGMSIGAIVIESQLIGVDTPEDLIRLKGALNAD